MKRIVDKAALLLTAIVLAGYLDSIGVVVALLIGVIAAALGIVILDWRLKSIYIAGFLVLCFILPELIYFLPIIFYDCVKERRAWIVYGSAVIYGILYYNTALFGMREFFIWLALLCLSVLLGSRTGRMEELERDMIRLRDTSTELNMVLQEKNKTLMEKQDYEIYLATLRERNRIAREIHDNVGHMLSRSILQIGAITTIHKEEPLCGQLGSVNDTLNHAMNSIRESVHDLHDDSIDLRQSINDATREMRERYHVTIDYDMSAQVSRNIKYCFITIVKEAMSNIVKHSDADCICLTLREHPGFYQLMVEDNGGNTGNTAGEISTADGAEAVQSQAAVSTGNTADNMHEGIGLSNMRERVEALHGTFRIHRERGFQIFVSIPKQQDV